MEDDLPTIWSNMQKKEKELHQKRLFLMGLSDTDSINDKKGKLPPENCEPMLESFLRKDDFFYEDLKKSVQKGFGVYNVDVEQHAVHGHMEFRNLHEMSKIILGLLDDFSDNGLYSLAKILTESSVTFEKTRSQMKKVIRKRLQFLRSKQCPNNQAELQSQVSEVLRNKKNFLENQGRHLKVTLQSHRDVVMKVLDGLGDMPTQTLIAMHRKLKGIHDYKPRLCSQRSGWSRDRLIDRIKVLSSDIIDQLDECDELPLPLAKAMAVAGLSSKLASGYEDLSLTKFVKLAPEIEALQSELFKAIKVLCHRIKKEKIKEVQQLLDPESQLEGKGVKAAMKNMLIEFLYESCGMDTIPDSLLSALSVINTKLSHRVIFSKELIEEEVECILNMSAATKQVLLDHIPDDNLDKDFADAYMEELVNTTVGDVFYDDDDDDDDDEEMELLPDSMQDMQVGWKECSEEVESTQDPEEAFSSSSQGSMGESSSLPQGLKKLSFPSHSPMAEEQLPDIGTQDPAKNNRVDFSVEKNPSPKAESDQTNKKSRNRYIALQEVSDKVSLVAYQLIGHMLEDFARIDGLNLDSDDITYLRGGCSEPGPAEDPNLEGLTEKDAKTAVLVRAVEKVIPSFSSSDMEKLKKFMNSK